MIYQVWYCQHIVSLFFSVSLSLSRSVCLSLSVCVCLCLFVCVCVCVCLELRVLFHSSFKLCFLFICFYLVFAGHSRHILRIEDCSEGLFLRIATSTSIYFIVMDRNPITSGVTLLPARNPLSSWITFLQMFLEKKHHCSNVNSYVHAGAPCIHF